MSPVAFPVSVFCPFCKLFTSLLNPGEPIYCDDDEVSEESWGSARHLWWIGVCNSCRNAMLVRDNGDIVYPIARGIPNPIDDRVPDLIGQDFDEAQQCFSVNAYRGCAVLARRAIEATCEDKGAKKASTLEAMIDDLHSKQIITKDIAGWAHVVRWIGNDAAHAGSPEVTRDDAIDVLELAKQILHIIYVAPAIAEERKKARGK